MPLMNSHIVEECLPFTSLRLDPEDINLSMGAGTCLMRRYSNI